MALVKQDWGQVKGKKQKLSTNICVAAVPGNNHIISVNQMLCFVAIVIRSAHQEARGEQQTITK